MRDDPSLPDVPARYNVNELRAAVGASPLAKAGDKLPAPASKPADAEAADDTDDADDAEPVRRRGSRTALLGGLGIAAALGGAALAVLGYFNSDRYVLACEAERAVPQQGRGFPPWGTRALAGEAWRPLKIAAETRCKPLETDDVLVLERAYLAMVLEQATALLTAREVTRVDDAEALLKQALLLTRPPAYEPEPLATQRTERHQEVEHLLGDVTYWRATARLRDAATALGDAAKQFDAAVAQHPKHASDAGAWAAYARRLAQELHTGPAGSIGPGAPPAASPAAAPSATPPTAGSSAAPPPASTTASEHLEAPLGVALPVEPGSAAPPAATAPPPDAGTTTGGVLL